MRCAKVGRNRGDCCILFKAGKPKWKSRIIAGRSKDNHTSNTDRVKYLRIALVVFGLIFLVGIYPLTILWPSGWSWHTGHSDYLQMILGIYATLGVFAILWLTEASSGSRSGQA